MVQTGEAAIFPLTPTAVATQKARGVPMEYAQPKEGSVAHRQDSDAFRPM